MKNKYKEQRGVTLVSLIVTIIIILILAGISIKASVGNDGIIEEAQNTKEQQERQMVEMQIDTIVATCELNSALDSNNSLNSLWTKLINAKLITEAPTEPTSTNEETGIDTYTVTTTVNTEKEILITHVESE